MAPRETPKPTKVQRTVKDTPAKGRASPIAAIKKTIFIKKTVEKTPQVSNIAKAHANRSRTNTVPKVSTPKSKENKSNPVPGSVTKSTKKNSAWKRRPKPAHSGVPIPEKMKKLMEKQFLDSRFPI